MPEVPEFALKATNLASAGLGAEGIYASDEFFGPLSRLLEDQAPIFIADKYDDHGKWMDGWETRRRRGPGHDHAIIKLAAPGQITGFNINTAHFTGNYPPACRIEGCRSTEPMAASTKWTELLSVASLGPDAPHFFACGRSGIFDHIRFSIIPDGGVARLKVFGRPAIPDTAKNDASFELSAAINGARVLAASDTHYGRFDRLLAPGRGLNMGDGWETRRRREPGHDWMVIALAARGQLKRALIDTAHFKGNFPESCSLQATDLSNLPQDSDRAIIASSMFWPELLGPKKLSADQIHDHKIQAVGPVTHVRFNIFPDGGISRLKLFGQLS